MKIRTSTYGGHPVLTDEHGNCLDEDGSLAFESGKDVCTYETRELAEGARARFRYYATLEQLRGLDNTDVTGAPKTEQAKAQAIVAEIESLSSKVTWQLEAGSVQQITLDPEAYRLLMTHASRLDGISWRNGVLTVGSVGLCCGGFEDEYEASVECESIERAIGEARDHLGDTTFLLTWQGVSVPVRAGDSRITLEDGRELLVVLPGVREVR